MKTTALKQINFLLVLFFVLFSFTKLNAQAPTCNYNVVNSGPCDIIVKVDYYDASNALCVSTTNTVLAFTSLPFTCSTCSTPLKNVVVTLITVANNVSPSSTAAVDINTTNDAGTLSANACNSSTNYTMDWFYNQTVVGY